MRIDSSYFFDLTNFPHASLFSDIDFPWNALQKLDSYLQTVPLGVHEGEISPQAYLIHPELISIGEGSCVEPGAYIQGPCVIGKYCTIRHGAYIRGQVLTGDYCVIGHDTEVKTAIFLNHVHAAHFAYVGDSILGHYVNLGAGTKCANFRLDQGTIHVHYEQQRFATQQRKLGALIGDYSQIGCNTVLNPGTLIGPYVKSYPCLNIGGFVPAHSVVKPRDPPLIITKNKTNETI